MIKLLLASLMVLLAQPTSASDIIYFCEKVEIKHNGAQFARIDNSDDFELEAIGKNNHIIKAKTTQPAYTTLALESGHFFQEYTFEQDCNSRQDKKVVLEN